MVSGISVVMVQPKSRSIVVDGKPYGCVLLPGNHSLWSRASSMVVPAMSTITRTGWKRLSHNAPW